MCVCVYLCGSSVDKENVARIQFFSRYDRNLYKSTEQNMVGERGFVSTTPYLIMNVHGTKNHEPESLELQNDTVMMIMMMAIIKCFK